MVHHLSCNTVLRRSQRYGLTTTIAGFLVTGLLAISTPQAAAQSLVEIYQAARTYDATYLAAIAQAKSTEYKSLQALSKRFPTLGATLLTTRTITGLPLSGQAAIVRGANANGNQYNTTRQGALQAKQTIFNATDTAQIHQAQYLVDAAQADLIMAEQDLMVRVVQAYFDVLAAQDQLATAQANVTAISEQLAAAKRNFEVGNATITDTREAQARADLASAQEIAATNDLMSKRAALDQLVGRPGIAPKPLEKQAVIKPLSAYTLDEWLTLSDNSPAIRKAQAGLEVAREEIKLAKAGHLPTLEVVGSFTRTHNNEPTNLLRPRGLTDVKTITLQGNLPLFTGYAVTNRVKETVALEEKSLEDLQGARRNVNLKTRQAYLGVQSGMASVKAYEAAQASSKLALEATELGYKVGVRVNIDVLNAQTQLYTTQRDLLKARYDLIMSNLKLRQIVGSLQEEDIVAINNLLVP